MKSLEEIVYENKKAEQEARLKGKQPYIAQFDGDEDVKNAPFIGDFTPEDWVKTEQFFVDSSGLGEPGEAALTFDQFLSKVKKHYGYAISECGEFQVYIQEFKRSWM